MIPVYMKKIKESQFIEILNGTSDKIIEMPYDQRIHENDIICINLSLTNGMYMGASVLVRIKKIWSTIAGFSNLKECIYIVERISDVIIDKYGIIDEVILSD